MVTYGAASEHFGGSLRYTSSADFAVPLPYGVGGARFIVCESGIEISAVLPLVQYLQASGRPQYVFANAAAAVDTLNIVEQDGSSTIASLAPGDCAIIYWTGTTWLVDIKSLHEGSPLSGSRQPITVVIPPNIYTNFNLAQLVDTLELWDQSSPVAIVATISSGSVFTATSTSQYGFDTSSWPDGSTLLLYQEADSYISGAGGDGGRGGDLSPGLLAMPGSNGGPAMRVRVATNVVRYGTVGGGGGGGGGGVRVSGNAGGGGGGGAGDRGGRGGSGGSNATGNAPSGALGQLLAYGRGGGSGLSAGGDGGAMGSAGNTAGAVGGLAGAAVHYDTAITYTQLRAGTVLGAITAV